MKVYPKLINFQHHTELPLCLRMITRNACPLNCSSSNKIAFMEQNSEYLVNIYARAWAHSKLCFWEVWALWKGTREASDKGVDWACGSQCQLDFSHIEKWALLPVLQHLTYWISLGSNWESGHYSHSFTEINQESTTKLACAEEACSKPQVTVSLCDMWYRSDSLFYYPSFNYLRILTILSQDSMSKTPILFTSFRKEWMKTLPVILLSLIRDLLAYRWDK